MIGRSLLLAACVAAAGLPHAAAAQIPPDADYRQFDTEHFRVIFPEPLEDFARRAAAGAEWAYAALSRLFIEPPGGRIALLIIDRTDEPGASATPIPWNRITLGAAPQLVSRQLNSSPDWVDLTVAHELVHIFHLDRATGIWTIPRMLFGRLPLLFPALTQPRWVIEGLATYYESRLTGAGRAYGAYFDGILASAAAEGAFRPVDAANGLVPRWPAGAAPYAYGGEYFATLAREHGDSAIAAFVRKAAGRLPYTIDWAATPIFGRSLSAGWADWRRAVIDSVTARADSLRSLDVARGEPLGDIGWAAAHPRFSPDGERLAFATFEPVDDPRTIVVSIGDPDAAVEREVRRFRRNGVGATAWSPDGAVLYYAQPDFTDRYRNFNDLYALDLASRSERRLTDGARLSDPDLSPDGRFLAAVQQGGGTNRIVRFDLESGVLEPITQFVDTVAWGRPRWSPDGRRLAAERWVRGGIVDISTVESRDGSIHPVTRGRAVDVAPAWSPDGRWLLFSSDRTGVFQIHALRLGEGVAPDPGATPISIFDIRHSTFGGAFDPDVSPDGRWLAYVAQYADGFRVERVPLRLPPPRDEVAEPVAVTGDGIDDDRPAGLWPGTPPVIDAPARRYSPFPSIWPTSWLPLVYSEQGPLGTFVGATTFGADHIGRHAYAAVVGWRFGIDEIEGGFAYLYSGLGDPSLQLTGSQEFTSFTALAPDSAQTPFQVVRRDREAALIARFVRPRFRWSFVAQPELSAQRIRLFSTDPRFGFQRSADTEVEGALGLGLSTARGYPRSVSSARGVIASLRLAHARRPRAGAPDPWRVSVEGVLRGYRSFPLFGYAHHVLAARLAAGLSSGRGGATEIFGLGGIPGQFDEPLPGVELGGGADYPLRGLGDGAQVGDRIVAGSLEYRFPLWLIGRGHGLWPVLLDRLSASLFLDAGSAWREADRVRTLASTGAELSLDLGLIYAIRYRVRLGLARTILVPSGMSPDWSAYLSGGVAF